MKKFLSILVCTCMLCTFAGCIFDDDKNSASGKNIKVYSETESTVFFYPVCPDCGHVSPMYSVDISKGEEHSTVHVCETCFEVYDVSIDRK